MSEEKIAGSTTTSHQETVAPAEPVPMPQETAAAPPTPDAPAEEAPAVEQLELISPEAPAPKRSPKPKASPKPKKPAAQSRGKGTSDRLEELEQRLETEVAAMQEARKELEAAAKVRREKGRLSYLREAGALGALTDDHLLKLAPDHDTETAEGRAMMDPSQVDA